MQRVLLFFSSGARGIYIFALCQLWFWVDLDIEFTFYRKKSVLKERNDTEQNKSWNRYGASIYAFSVMTTIGWGNIVPITVYGRMATILYGFVGIPLLFTLSSEVGNFTTKLIRLFTNLLARMCVCMRQEDKSVNRYLNRNKDTIVDTDLAIRLDTKGALDSGYNHPSPDGHPAPAPRRYAFTKDTERDKPVSKSGLDQDWGGGGDYNAMANKNSSYLNSVVSTLDFLLEASLDPSAWKHGQGMCKDKDDAQVKIGDGHGGKESFQYDSWKSWSSPRCFEKPHYRLRSTEDAIKMSEALSYLTVDEFCRIMKFVGFDFDKEVLEKSHALTGNSETAIHRLARKETPERKLRGKKDTTREGQGVQRDDNSNTRKSSKSRKKTNKTFKIVRREENANSFEKEEVRVIGKLDEDCLLQASDFDDTRTVVKEAKENFEYYHKNDTKNEERKEKNKQKIQFEYQNVSDASEKTSSSLGRESHFQTGHKEKSENRKERRKILNVKNCEDKETIYRKESSLYQLIGSDENNTRAEDNKDIGFSCNALKTDNSHLSIERRAISEDRLQNKAMHCISKHSVPPNEFLPEYSLYKQGYFKPQSAASCSHPTQVVGKSLGAADTLNNMHFEHLVNPFMETCYESTHLSFHDALPPPITTKATARKQITVSKVMLNDCASKSESTDQDFCDDINKSGHFDIISEKWQSVTARSTECLVNTGPSTGRKMKPLVKDSVQYDKTSFQMMQVKQEQKSHTGCSEVKITSLTAMCSGRKDLKHQSSAELIESENPLCQRSMLMDPLTDKQRPQSNSLPSYEQVSQPQAVRPESVTPEKKQCPPYHHQSERGQQPHETGLGGVMHAENNSRFTKDETLKAETSSSLAELVDRNLIHTKSPLITFRGNGLDLINQKSSESVTTPFHNSAIPATSGRSNHSILDPKDQILDLTEPEKICRSRSSSISEEESFSSRQISAMVACQGIDETKRERSNNSRLLTQIATESCLRQSPNINSPSLDKPFTQNIPAVSQTLKRRSSKNRYKKSSVMAQVNETIDPFVSVTNAIQINDQSTNVPKLLYTSTMQKKTDTHSSSTLTKCQKVKEGVLSYSLPRVVPDNPNELGIKDQPDSHISNASGDSKLPKVLSRRGHVRRQLCKKWVEQSYPFVYENERRKIAKAKINCSSEGLTRKNLISSVAMVTEPKKTSENDLRETKKNSRREIKASPIAECHHVNSGSNRSNYRRLYTKQWVDIHSSYTEEMNTSMQQKNKPNVSQSYKKSYNKQSFSKDARRCLADNPPNMNNGMTGRTRQVDETLDSNRQNNVLFASDVKSSPIETSGDMELIHDFNMSNLHGKESSSSVTRKKSGLLGKSPSKKSMSRVSRIVDPTHEAESGDAIHQHASKPMERKKYRVDRFAIHRPTDKRTLKEDLVVLKDRLGNVASSVASGEDEEVELPLICIYIGMGLFMAFGAFMNYVVNKDVDDWFVSIYFVYALCSTTGFGDILPQPESYLFQLFYGLAGVSMFNIVVNATLQYMMATIEYLKIYFKSSS